MTLNFEHFENATNWNHDHHDALKKKQCHFRGNFGGVSLVSLHPDSPELGITGVTDPVAALEDGINEVLAGEGPHRDTPEKQLQAWLINRILFGKAPEFWTKYKLTFLTSELAWSKGPAKPSTTFSPSMTTARSGSSN